MEAIKRRDFLGGLAAAICAPYVVRNSGILMPIADRSLAAYSVIGHDALGNRISETITVSMQRARAIRAAAYKSRRYGELVEPIFQQAFARRKLRDYSPRAVGPIYPRGKQPCWDKTNSDWCVYIQRGDEFLGVNHLLTI